MTKYSIECLDGRFLCYVKGNSGSGRKYRESKDSLFNKEGKQIYFKYFTTIGRANSWVVSLNTSDAMRFDFKTNKECFDEKHKWFIKEQKEI